MHSALALAAVLATVAASGMAAAHGRISTKLTWTRDIGPLVEKRCGACHVGQGEVPSFATYADARPWAAAMKEELLSRRMPPWPAAEGAGAFANDRSLSASEIDSIVDWIEGGAPEGDPAEGRPPEQPVASEAERVVPLRIPAGARVQTVIVDPALSEDALLEAWTLRPGRGAFLVSARVAVGREADVLLWSAGERWVGLAAGTAVRVEKGALLAVELHFSAAVVAPQEGAALLLRIGRTPRAEVKRLRVRCRDFTIPAGRRLVSIAPELRPRHGLRIVAHRPDDSREALLALRPSSPIAPTVYRALVPVPLPEQTRIEIATEDLGCRLLLELVDGDR